MKNLVMVVSMVVGLASCGRPDATSSEAASVAVVKATPVVVNSFNAEPTNAGINPTARATEISVSFTSGSNACMARFHKYTIDQGRVGNVVHVVVNSTPVVSPFKVACTMEYMPVYATLQTVVRSSTITPVKIIVDNVKGLGKNVEVKI